jgi:hypothetical protein
MSEENMGGAKCTRNFTRNSYMGYSTTEYSNVQQLKENLTLQKRLGYHLFASHNGQ